MIKSNPVQGTIKSAEYFKEGGKLIKVVVETMKGDYTFRAFDTLFLSMVGKEGEFNTYVKENTYNGKTEKQWYLQDLTPRKQFSKARPSSDLEARVRDLELGQTALFGEINKLKERGTANMVEAAKEFKNLQQDLDAEVPF